MARAGMVQVRQLRQRKDCADPKFPIVVMIRIVSFELPLGWFSLRTKCSADCTRINLIVQTRLRRLAPDAFLR